MIIAVMNSWFALLFICLRPFILINSTHMCSDVSTLRPRLALTSNMHRSDKETRGICCTTDQQGDRGDCEGKWDRDEERGGEDRERERERQREREWMDGTEGGGGLDHPVTLRFPGHTAPELLYPPLAINHLVLSLLNHIQLPHILIREERQKQNTKWKTINNKKQTLLYLTLQR